MAVSGQVVMATNIPAVSSAVQRGYPGGWEIDADGRLMLKGLDPAQSSVWPLTPLAAEVAG